MNVAFYQVTQLQQDPQNFTIVVLPDTQFYSESYPQIFSNQTQWIVNNKANMNIIFVTHEGDIVNVYNSATQWTRANSSMSKLDDAELPYGFAIGNHDNNYGASYTDYNTYFPYSRYSSESWYGGAYNNNNANSFQLFSNGDDQYLILHLEYQANSSVLAWAGTVLSNYPTRRVILVTHEYMTGSGGARSSYGTTLWNNFISPHADQIFLVLTGHATREDQRTDVVNGHTVYQLLADYQSDSSGGNGWLRMLDFRPAEDIIYVKTFSTWLNQYETDANSQFTLNYDMTGQAYTPPVLIGTALNVPSGNTASIQWNGLAPMTEYYWYAVADDQNGGVTQSNTWSFTTGTGTVSRDIQLSAGWNMVSFPILPADTSFASIFAGKGYYQVLTWTGTSYVTATNAEAGKGYWVLVLSATTLTIEGTPVNSYQTDLPAGWSMIGSVNDGDVSCASVFPGYYQCLTWSGTSYVTATTIEPGKGYWVLVLSPTHITVN
jgi:hypothetical protein